jgi:S-methylmethionine-dependent homocysteine/selenocysteine methylase
MFDTLVSAVERGRPVLGDGAIGTRLGLQSPLRTDESLGVLPLVRDELGSAAIRAILTGYCAVGTELGLPVVIDAPIWWGRPDRFDAAGWSRADGVEVLKRCTELTASVARRYPDAVVSASIGPATDGYLAESISVDSSASFHRFQVEALADSPADYILAATFTTVDDLLGAARVLAETDKPYALGPVVDASGRLPDGTTLVEAIDRVESSDARPPSFWAVCCTHPSVALGALEVSTEADPAATSRIRQVKGNGTAASEAERDTATTVLTDEPEPWAEAAYRLFAEHGVTIVGGCCGTDDRHMLSLAIRLAGD